MKYSIGYKGTNKKGEQYEIIGCSPSARTIRFLNTGYETKVTVSNLSVGSITDYCSPSICGRGVVGFKGASTHLLYPRWRAMIDRCYNPKSRSYKDYGAKGCEVHPRWLFFPSYIEDVESMPNYQELAKHPDLWCIDKDIKNREIKLYSKETCSIIPIKDNSAESNRVGNNLRTIYQYSKEGVLLREFSSIKEAQKHVGAKYGTGITKCAQGYQKTSHGFIWSYNSSQVNE